MSADLFDKFQPVLDQHARLPEDASDPFAVQMDEVHSQTEATINGRRTILAGTNNYMGMTFDQPALKAASEALQNFGTGTTGSRVLNGTYSSHKALEATLADFYGTKYAMVFSTGYQANLGILSTLAGKDDYIIIDADSHASIYDGCALGNASIMRFRHNDASDLDKRLGRIPADAGKLVVIETVYSMLGDKAPLAEIIEVTKKHGAYLAVDEAHSMGIYGKTGRGVCQELGLEDGVDFIIGTFSKSVGTVGGFCVSDHDRFEILRLVCRPYMFTASLPPSVVASATSAINSLRHADNLRGSIWESATRLHGALKEAGFKMGTSSAESPIVAVCLAHMEMTTRFWSGLLERGVYVNMAVPPATPGGLCLLRCSVCAAHNREQIETIIQTFRETALALGLKPSETHPVGEETEKDKDRQGPDASAATS